MPPTSTLKQKIKSLACGGFRQKFRQNSHTHVLVGSKQKFNYV